MAFSYVNPLLLSLFLAVPVMTILSSSLAEALTCATQKLTDTTTGKAYAECTDLPALGAYLHYTHNPANSSLSVAFLAPSTGWISWAINPTATGMVGSQALMALKPASGAVVAKTYNISSYHSIVEGKLSFEVWDLKADESNGTMRLYGSVKVPAGATSLNQVWQVGSSVNGTHPSIHSMAPDNKNSKSTLDLVDSTVLSPSGSPSGGVPVAAPVPVPGSGAPGIESISFGLIFSFVLILLCGNKI